MDGETRRSLSAGSNRARIPEAERRPYEAPTVQAFGRKLPAFAPPSPPPPPGARPPFTWFGG